MISDVTAVLMRDFSANLAAAIAAKERGEDPAAAAAGREASGLAIGLAAVRMALMRVFRRFFVPYRAPG
jgi:hypothetical protein